MALSRAEKTQKRQEIIQALQRPGFPEHLQEKDIPNLYIVIEPELRSGSNFKINYIVSTADVSGNKELLRKSLHKELELFIQKNIKTYLFSQKKWKNEVPIVKYLKKCIKIFSNPNMIYKLTGGNQTFLANNIRRR